MATPVDTLIQQIQAGNRQGALQPLIQKNLDRISTGSQPYTKMQNYVGAASILNKQPILHKDPGNHGILSDLEHLPGNLLSDATNTIQGFFSPWKWIPTIYHNFEHFSQTGDMSSLLPLIPGYTTAKDILGGDFHDILTHPVGTMMDVLPYMHMGLPVLADTIYGETGKAAATAAEEVKPPFDIKPEPTPGQGEIVVYHGENPKDILKPEERWFTDRKSSAESHAGPGGKVYATTMPEDIFRTMEQQTREASGEVGAQLGPLRSKAALDYGPVGVGKDAYDITGGADLTATMKEGNVPRIGDVILGDTTATPGGTLLDRQSRLEYAMRSGKPGSLLYNLLPDKITDPNLGMVGRRLENVRELAISTRRGNVANRAFQRMATEEYIKPLKKLFDSWTESDRKGFALWWENRNDNTPGIWKDVTGAEHQVPEEFLKVAPQVEDILNSFEKKFGEYFHHQQWDGKTYLYDQNSPVVRADEAIARQQKKLIDARTDIENKKQSMLQELGKSVTPKPSDHLPNSAYAKSRYSLFKLKDRIEREQARFERLLFQRSQVTDRAKYLQISERLDKIRNFLEEAQKQHDLLSQREMLHWHLSQPENSVFHAKPEEYHLLDVKDPGTQGVTRAYLKSLKKYDDLKKELDAALKSRDKVLKQNAPATFYPRIKDKVLQNMIDKYKSMHPDFAEKTTGFDWEATKAAFDKETFGRNPVELGLATEKEVNQQIREIESTWQEMAREGFHPMYLSSVPADRMKSVLDPNLFKSGALRDEPYSVRARVRDITPSGIHDPVIGLTAPALALIRRKALQEFYGSFLGHFTKDQEALSSWVDKELQAMQMRPLDPGETWMSRRDAIIRQRWSVVNPKELDPDMARLFEGKGRIYLPKEMYESIKKLFAPIDHELKSASKANITGLRVFRTSIMTASLKHLAHIMFGGMTMLMMRGSLEEWSPARMAEAWHMIKDNTYPEGLSAGVDYYSSDEVKQAELPRGERQTLGQKAAGTIADKVAGIQHGEEFVSNWQRALSYLSERDRIMAGKVSPDLTLFENQEVKSAMERYKASGKEEDYNHALDMAKRGAIRHANKALVDFDGMLPAERGIIRNIFPFYAFTRHIFKTAFTYPMDYPLRATFVYRIGQMQQEAWDKTGLPNDWMRYLTFGPDASGNVTNVDLRFLNPFRTMPDMASGDIAGSLNPFLGYMLQWAGVNQFSTSAQRNVPIRYNPETGFVDTKREPFNIVNMVKDFVPEVGALDILTGKVKPGDVYNKIPTYGFIPAWPYHMNENLVRAQDAQGQLQEAQQAISDALKTGNTDAVRQWNLVPLQGQLVPGSKIADIIDGLKGKGTPKQQLGLR